MAGEDTELTFVRCPSCRSLVPAVSTRCRMCGASLDSFSKKKKNENSPPAKSVKEKVLEEPSADFDDPLSAYIEEVLDDDMDVNEEEAFVEEVPAPKKKVSPSKQVPVSPIDPIAQNDLEDDMDEEVSEPQVKTKPKDSLEVKAKDSFDKEIDVDEDDEIDLDEDDDLFGELDDEIEDDLEEDEDDDLEDEEEDDLEDELEDDLLDDLEEGFEEEFDDELDDLEDEDEDEDEDELVVESKFKNPRNLESTELWGWLVLSEAGGAHSAHEIRVGKCFVSRGSLKGNDIIIEHDSISTPHAMISASIGDGLHVQDLMSDNGVMYASKGKRKYQKINDKKTLRHGDYVKFGDLEFIVVRIPYAE